MVLERIDLYEHFQIKREGAKAGTLACYRHGQVEEMNQKVVRPAMLVIPGGGYGMVSERETEPVAMEYYHAGFDAFVLYYDVAPVCYPVQLCQAAMAMMYIRKNAETLDLLPDKLAAVGFSAGGHLLGCISTIWDDPAVKALFGEECVKVRPDASVYSYPVVSSDEKIWHRGSFASFCGGKVRAEDYSIEKRVNSSCKPAFIWANTPDDCVPAQNSLRLYEAYLAAGVPVELHIFRDGWHGMSVCAVETERSFPVAEACVLTRSWIGLSESFLQSLGFAPIK